MIYPGADTFRDSPRNQEPKPRPSEPRAPQRSPQPGGRPSGPERAAFDAPRYVPYQDDPDSRQQPRTASKGPQYTHQPGTKYPPPDFGDLETHWRQPPNPLSSPPPRRPGSDTSGGRRRDGHHDTARSRLDDRVNREGSPDPPGRRPPEHHRTPSRQNWERHRVVMYREPHSRSSYSSNNSMRTAHPAARHSRHHGRRDPGGRSHARSQAGDSHHSKQISPMAKLEEKKTGLEKFVTPLRLGLLLGCFDMIGGSLSAWMTYKRFGAAAQAAEAAKQAAIQQQKSARSSRRPRSKGRSHRRSEAPAYDEVSESDSEYEERQKRVAEHIMDQQRLERGRSRR